MTFTQHIPNFVDAVAKKIIAPDLGDLLNHPDIKHWEDKNFIRWSCSDYKFRCGIIGHMLMCEFRKTDVFSDYATSWWVVGYLTDGDASSLPEWSSHKPDRILIEDKLGDLPIEMDWADSTQSPLNTQDSGFLMGRVKGNESWDYFIHDWKHTEERGSLGTFWIGEEGRRMGIFDYKTYAQRLIATEDAKKRCLLHAYRSAGRLPFQQDPKRLAEIEITRRLTEVLSTPLIDSNQGQEPAQRN